MDVNPYQAPASGGSYSSAQGAWSGSQADPAVTPKIVEMLRQTQPWVRFLSVLGFIGFVLLMLGAVGGLMFGLAGGRMEGALIAVPYGLFGVLYLAPAVFLGRYATRIAQLRMSLHVQDLEDALEAQKSFWRFVGIAAVVVMILYAIGVVVMVVAGFTWFSASSRAPF